MRNSLLKNINLKTLNLTQKKALAISAVFVLSLIVLWVFIYVPSRNTVKKLKVQLVEVCGQIDRIEERVNHAKSLEEGIKLLEANLKKIKNRYPSEEEESIKMLASFAKELNISVDSTRPLPREELLDATGVPLKIKGKSYYKIPVALSLKCSFADLVKFTGMVERKLPAFTIIQKLTIASSPLDLQILSVSMDLNLYFITAK